MRNLTAAEFSLAHDGAIAPDLLRRSSSYYWQTAAQERSRHELICEKTTRWHILTFGSHGNYWELAKRKCHGNGNGGTFAPNRAETRRLHRQLGHKVRNVDTCTNLTVASLPKEWAAAHGINASVRGAGYWRWKPYAIQQKLASMGEGEVLAWMDYDLVLLDHEPWSLCLGQNVEAGVAGFHFPCLTDRAWTKRELADAIGADDRMMDSAQLYGGLVVLRNGPFARRFVGEWLHWATSGLETDEYDPRRQHPRFRGHRHDQSILSLLAKKHRVKTFPLPTKSHDVRDVWSWEAGACRTRLTPTAGRSPSTGRRRTSRVHHALQGDGPPAGLAPPLRARRARRNDAARPGGDAQPLAAPPRLRRAAPACSTGSTTRSASARREGAQTALDRRHAAHQAAVRGRPRRERRAAAAPAEHGRRRRSVRPIRTGGAPCRVPAQRVVRLLLARPHAAAVGREGAATASSRARATSCAAAARAAAAPTGRRRRRADCGVLVHVVQLDREAKAFYRDGEVWPKDDAEWV